MGPLGWQPLKRLYPLETFKHTYDILFWVFFPVLSSLPIYGGDITLSGYLLILTMLHLLQLLHRRLNADDDFRLQCWFV